MTRQEVHSMNTHTL